MQFRPFFQVARSCFQCDIMYVACPVLPCVQAPGGFVAATERPFLVVQALHFSRPARGFTPLTPSPYDGQRECRSCLVGQLWSILSTPCPPQPCAKADAPVASRFFYRLTPAGTSHANVRPRASTTRLRLFCNSTPWQARSGGVALSCRTRQTCQTSPTKTFTVSTTAGRLR